MNWQSLAAVAIVLVTLVIFIARAMRPPKKPGCGGGCGCDR